MSYVPLEQKLYDAMLADAGLSALVGSNIFPVQLPHGIFAASPPLRAIVYGRKETTRYRTQDSGTNVLARIQVRFTAYCKGLNSELDALSIMKALIAFLNNFSATALSQHPNTVLSEAITNYPQTQPPLYQGILDARIWNREDEGEDDMQVVSLTLSSAQIENLEASPVTIITQSSGGYIAPIFIGEAFIPGTVPFVDYSGNTAGLSIKIGNQIVDNQQSLSAAAIVANLATQISIPGNQPVPQSELNLPLVVTSFGDGRISASSVLVGGDSWQTGDVATDNAQTPNVSLTVTASGGAITSYSMDLPGTGQVVGALSLVPRGIGSLLTDYSHGARQVTINNPGSGYAQGDQIFMIDGGWANAPILNVDSVDGGGGVTGLSIVDAGNFGTTGTNYTTAASTGVGVGLTVDVPSLFGASFQINVTAIQAFAGGNGTIKITVGYVVVDVP